MISASALPRVSTCAASAVLPAVGETSDAAERGAAIHAYLAEYLRHGRDRDRALSAVSEQYRDDCVRIDVEAIPRWRVALVEETLAPIDGVGGTADVVVLDDEPDIVVIDWKTGHEINRERYRAQIEHYALCAADQYGAWRADACLAWVRDDGAIAWDRWTVDLSAARERLRRTLAQVESARAARDRGESLSVTTSAHCRYCPAWRYCPAQRALSESLLVRSAELDPLALYDAAKAAERAARVALDTLRDRLRAGDTLTGLTLTSRGALKREDQP